MLVQVGTLHAQNSLKSNTSKTFTHEKADEHETEWFDAVQAEGVFFNEGIFTQQS